MPGRAPAYRDRGGSGDPPRKAWAATWTSALRLRLEVGRPYG